MKKVLITGANSYVGTSVEKWLMREPEKYYVDTLDMKNPNWRDYDFSNFDVVLHVAGIAHVSSKKSMKDMYFKINRDLAIETALIAKSAKVKQFIFMSSMIVYNSRESKITLNTRPNPDNYYGLSKLQAEIELKNIESDDFKICILRPPMIYGQNSKGNFSKLVSFSKKTIFFPNFVNTRSILYIENLALFIQMFIDKESHGLFFPQNKDYFSTKQLIVFLRENENKSTITTKLFNPIIKLLLFMRIKLIVKVFGDFFYDIKICDEDCTKKLYTFEKSICRMGF